MTSEDLIALAQEIAHALGSVRRNTWLQWVQIAGNDLQRGIRQAAIIARDPTVRTRIQEEAKQIREAIQTYREKLQRLSPQERRQVFGWIARLLVIREQPGRSRHGRLTRSGAHPL